MNAETKELLVLAAKAMGFEVVGFSSTGNTLIKIPGGGPESCLAKEWNPLTNDTDLVDMECQMKVEVIWAEDRCIATAWFVRECFAAHELYSKHPSRRAAKAMASLRVVAEIGSVSGNGADYLDAFRCVEVEDGAATDTVDGNPVNEVSLPEILPCTDVAREEAGGIGRDGWETKPPNLRPNVDNLALWQKCYGEFWKLKLRFEKKNDR